MAAKDHKKAQERRRRELERLQQVIEAQKEQAKVEKEQTEESAGEEQQEKPSEESRERPEASPPAPPSTSSPSTPPEKPWDFSTEEHWDWFLQADLDTQIAVFLEGLTEGTLVPEDPYAMLSQIRSGLDIDTPEDRARYAELVDKLRQQAPDLYAQDAGYFQYNLIHDAVIDERWDRIPDLLSSLAEQPGRYINTFQEAIDLLMYYGQTQTIINAMDKAWSEISKSGEITSWGVSDFAQKARCLHFFHYLETTEHPRADDPNLEEATDPYGEWTEEWLEMFIRHFTASEPSDWHPEDFGPTVDAEQWGENLSNLLIEFMAEQQKAEVPISRSHMFRSYMLKILKRQLRATPEPLPLTSNKQGSGKRRSKIELTVLPSSLIPRHDILNENLGNLLQLFGSKPCKVAAVIELLPAYLHFLARLDLIHPREMDASLDELYPLQKPIADILGQYGTPFTVAEAVQSAWSDEALDALREDPELVEARERPLPSRERPPKPTAQPGHALTYTFKVTYQRDPDVWRIIEIAADQTLHNLHYAIQAAVDFDRTHLYSFYMSNKAWDQNSEYTGPRGRGPSAAHVQIGELDLRLKQRFLYLFDYGDEHRFEVQLISINVDAPKDVSYPRELERHGEDPEQYRF
jgi:hypothetical protein